jgi:hypothetical protein
VIVSRISALLRSNISSQYTINGPICQIGARVSHSSQNGGLSCGPTPRACPENAPLASRKGAKAAKDR